MVVQVWQLSASAALMLFGALGAVWNVVAGLAVLATGGCWVAIIVATQLRRRDALRQELAGDRLPLTPRISSVSVVDTISGHAELGRDQRYKVANLVVSGRLLIEGSWPDSARGRVDEHRRQRRLAPNADVAITAGALVLGGPVGLTLSPDSGRGLVHGAVLPLDDQSERYQMLSSDTDRGDRKWKISAGYDLTPKADDKPTMPIWLTPAIAARSRRRALDLEIQWEKFGPKEGLVLDSIELLRVNVPAGWGRVVFVEDSPTVGSQPSESGTGKRRIEWRNIVEVPHEVRGRRCISLTFEEEIRSVDSLYGEIVARFRRNLCGVDLVRLFGPDGAPRREQPTRKLFTTARLTFRLSLAAARYQDIRVLPPGAHSAEGNGVPTDPDIRENQETYDRVVPDGRTIAALTSALSENGYYIKRVVENMPQPGKTASVAHRYWNVTGRKYHGICPIDFHLALTGDEEHSGGALVSGKTIVSLSMQGAYADPETDTTIHEEWQSLRRRVRVALERCRLRNLEPPGAASICEFVDELADQDDIVDDIAERLKNYIRDVLGGKS